ncbi:hypothetical protein Syun_027362 [Stephania yunnanensis]|uniref:Uncharacterized protein n=1 Tax=Stephania yunnanensis TaxID=152371 RepID=A0AAP0EFH4_9MAGN
MMCNKSCWISPLTKCTNMYQSTSCRDLPTSPTPITSPPPCHKPTSQLTATKHMSLYLRETLDNFS